MSAEFIADVFADFIVHVLSDVIICLIYGVISVIADVFIVFRI
jgi:hypothetical protein